MDFYDTPTTAVAPGVEPIYGPLGADPLPPDFRDVPLASFLSFGAPRPFFKDHHSPDQPWLNQGSEGACVGFGFVNAYNANPNAHREPNATAFDWYRKTTERDEYRGDWRSGQSGTSIRSGAKEGVRRGALKTYAFAASVDLILKYIRDYGPVVVGVPWYRSMDKVDSKGFTRVYSSSGIRGWHCVEFDGADTRTTGGNEPHVIYPNSWGNTRRFKISIKALAFLMNHSGAAGVVPTEVFS